MRMWKIYEPGYGCIWRSLCSISGVPTQKQMDGVAQTTLTMEHGIFGKDFMHPFLLIGITLDDCAGKRKDKSQNGGVLSPMPRTWT